MSVRRYFPVGATLPAIAVVAFFPMLGSLVAAETPTSAATTQPVENKLPRLVDLGASKCIPCKMMAPILETLEKEYAGSLHVEFIDVWKNPDAGKTYSVRAIPTQIFYDATGKEVFRHEGFMAKDDILAKWKELGVNLSPKAN